VALFSTQVTNYGQRLGFPYYKIKPPSDTGGSTEQLDGFESLESSPVPKQSNTIYNANSKKKQEG
jgi:hypothetical protein